ncbi:putative Ig domain-containing protein [Rhodococcus sp. IEGM 1379]|uniref:putative Ig domain-containing protein n=1 Tax=Rhodococcus sp. IEGM 1379 TaxID=3047086 RepID=UPI0024B6D8CF|nr:putative Ig domain-containing protein [Rhodococcus sp. IEGM 1379]MDI9918657.1 putative Ig domain-containing protein [Rhodococcus sp. IEGM 1379]
MTLDSAVGVADPFDPDCPFQNRATTADCPGGGAVDPPLFSDNLPLVLTGVVGTAISDHLFTVRGNPTPTLTATGLPTGITFTNSTLAGTPTEAITSTITITISATNTSGTTTKTVTLTVTPTSVTSEHPATNPFGSLEHIFFGSWQKLAPFSSSEHPLQRAGNGAHYAQTVLTSGTNGSDPAPEGTGSPTDDAQPTSSSAI